MFLAHSPNQAGQAQPLVEHLKQVAEQAREFASEFGAGDLAYLVGLWHDLGKFDPEFQAYLSDSARKRGPDHKRAGAKLALEHISTAALVIQGHHGGLQAPAEFQTWLNEIAAGNGPEDVLRLAEQELRDLIPAKAMAFPPHIQESALSAELFLRMLFSALVDADYLDTETHFDYGQALHRSIQVTIRDLWDRFEAHQLQASGKRNDPVNRARHQIYQACLAAAEYPPGIFRLSVPTGGGKTLSAMGFALRHSLLHGQRRVIVAVPFISITEQTADVYRRIFEPGPYTGHAVLEHHSSLAEPADWDDRDKLWMRLAAENWDAPIIVTTTVQLFGSLFSNRVSRARKLHNLARSVVILDEAQALPAHLLDPILDALREMSINYGTTVLISTATQPAFDSIPSFAAVPAIEILPESDRLFKTLKRVEYQWPGKTALTWEDAAGLLRKNPQSLAVLNTKKDALALLDALDDPDALHLSTLLCGAHRRAVIKEVHERLARGEPCRLVSTQVIEAGVDLDFPLVLRALGPLDAIIQSAGRCNREGRLSLGRVIVFKPQDGGMPQGIYRTATDITEGLLGRPGLDPDDPEVSGAYFRQLFDTVETDREGIQALRRRLNYPEVAQRFKMIEDDTESVIVTAYGTLEERQAVADAVAHLLSGDSAGRLLMRKLQPFIVSVRSRQADYYRRQGLLIPVMDGLGEWRGAYDPVKGITDSHLEPDLLVV